MVPALFVFFVSIIVLVWYVLTYNKLNMLGQRVKNAWSQIDVQLTRRHGLIPNLVEVAKGYMAHERQTLEDVIKARTQATQATAVIDKAGAENLLTSALKSLFVVMEKYPDLKANQNMLGLQEELTTTENRISFARQYYNDEAMFYNTAIKSMPDNIVAAIAVFKPEPFFKIEDPAHLKAPEVKF